MALNTRLKYLNLHLILFFVLFLPLVSNTAIDIHEIGHIDCAYLTELIKEGKHPAVSNNAVDISDCSYLFKALERQIQDQLHSSYPLVDHSRMCPHIQELSRQKQERRGTEGSFTKTIFAYLFPGGPRVNSILATFYISSVPNFILFFVPPDIRPSSLNSLVSFAVGGLLGDVFLHLLPQSFLGESLDDRVHFVQVDEKKNVVIGLAIFVGLVTFFVIDKMMRVANGGEEGGHSHSHSHSNEVKGTSSATEKQDKSSLRQRKPADSSDKDKNHDEDSNLKKKAPSTSIKLSAYLNLIADATHNFTDGLAMAASFYASQSVGATTTVAVFFHEIPHEVGDYALLVQSGFTKQYALLSQFATALGAFLGTFAGIAIEELSRGEIEHSGSEKYVGGGIWDTGVHVGDLVIPFTAGGFLYIATVGVIPELLEVTGKLNRDLRQAGIEFLAMFIGLGMMAIIAWNEAE